MKTPIPNRLIRLAFRELLYLKLEEASDFQPIGIAFQNASRGCQFGREMIDRAFELIIEEGFLQSNKSGISLLKSQYKFTQKGKELISKGNYEEVFSNSITTRKFFFTNNGEYGFSDIYKKNLLKWKLLNYEIDVDPITSEYFEIAKNLNYQIWEEDQVIKLASKYLGHIRMIQFPSRLIRKLKLEIYEKGKEESKLRLLIADNNLRGALMEGKVNEYNPKDYKMRIWQMEHSIIPQILKLLGAKLVETKRLINA
jgi:hypothetical protein